ncbi:methenyltetrahydrofolate cyclohydrolase /5,10-methylenetetrahydrofolate dehydrogenase (NADP+) [Sulfuritortus calidifontis]|uniref:Bifunctional protein FolD n=1 Tax=Sulfuritortus calidifontis TaxID=1914471 RepID=A0A4R3JY12_9PROT|nr:bifunctional methylenetetrahydrofolate dehydrogenase/methenyltetrahydrofolate cyclohydrolase FolD [Sulfuritortus calidifontis]TCS73442.1 methenyltetrahydrofolate cyclohydrolase /5,10-methylenetetrahydrofolate dehydrogenase (NADP+) [Sulfuritortus calidifontis]
MSARILDGKAIADRLLQDIKRQVDARVAAGKPVPGLAVILIGGDPASSIYVRNKRRACETAGVRSFSHDLPATTSQAELMALIDQLNADPAVDGILVQAPLPEQIDDEAVVERIRADKDVDGFHPYNIGRLAVRMPTLRSCTPYGVMKLLAATGEPLRGKHAVVVGASNHVGRPMALELLLAGCTVTVCHSATQDLAGHVGRADIVVAAVGRPQMVQGAWIKPGATVIDIGINRLDDGRIVGDVEFEAARDKAAWITPVPGGVGPMTVATLLQNTLEAAAVHHP